MFTVHTAMGGIGLAISDTTHFTYLKSRHYPISKSDEALVIAIAIAIYKAIAVYKVIVKKSRIPETLNLSTDADRSTNNIFFFFFFF